MEASTLFSSLASPATSQSTSDKPFPETSSRAASVVPQDERRDGLTHIAHMAQPILLLHLADLGGQKIIVKHVRYPTREVSSAGVIAYRTGRVTLQQGSELF